MALASAVPDSSWARSSWAAGTASGTVAVAAAVVGCGSRGGGGSGRHRKERRP